VPTARDCGSHTCSEPGCRLTSRFEGESVSSSRSVPVISAHLSHRAGTTRGAPMSRPETVPTSTSRLVPLADGAAHFHVSVKTLRRRIADGTIAVCRVGRLTRAELDDLTQRLGVTTPSARPA